MEGTFGNSYFALANKGGFKMNSLYRTMFFVPGNDPHKIVKAEVYRPDCIIYDLEDAVSIAEKDSARILVKYALKEIRPDIRVGVRINGIETPFFEEDVRVIAPLCPDFLRLPKTEKPEEVQFLDKLISEIEQENNIAAGTIKIVCTIETALGVYNAYKLATASPRVLAIGLGAEDFCTDMKTTRSADCEELRYARGKIVLDAHAAQVLGLDFVYSDIKNTEGFLKNVLEAKQLGYTGKSVVHPDQIAVVHECYSVTSQEIEHAKAVLAAYDEAMVNGSGVIALNGKMIDAPMVTRAKDILAYAREAGV